VTDNMDIAELLNDSASAWSRGDLDAFMGCYEDSPHTAYVSQGGIVHGHQAIRAMYEARFGGGRCLGMLATEVINLLPIGRRHAIVTGRYQLARPFEAKATGLFTLVARKTKGAWRILIDHSS
jgi:uncharacterized protein (TIGR02246 family)